MLKTLIIGFAIRYIALVLAVCAITWFASQVDAHTLSFWTTFQRGAPIASFYAIGWTFTAWRETGGDIVVHNRGCPPLLIALFIGAVAVLPMGVWAPRSIRVSSRPKIEKLSQPNHRGSSTFEWNLKGAVRSDRDGRQVTFPDFPRPSTINGHNRGAHWPTIGVRILLAFILITLLVLWPTTPTMGLTLILSSVFFVASDLFARLA